MIRKSDVLRWPIEKKSGSGKDKQDGGDLRAFDKPVEYGAAPDGIAPELGDVKDDTGADQKESRNIALLPTVRNPEYEPGSEEEKADCGVGLHGMYGNAERSIAPAGGEWIGVDDGPGETRAGSVTGAGKERAGLLECEAHSDRRREDVGRRAIRHAMQTGVHRCDCKGDERCEGGEKRVVHRGDA